MQCGIMEDTEKMKHVVWSHVRFGIPPCDLNEMDTMS